MTLERLARADCGPLLLLAVPLTLLIFNWSALPFQDLPDWIFQARLLQAWLAGQLPGDYAFVSAVPPNALSTVALAIAASAVSMDTATRGLAWLAALLVPLGIARLLQPRDWRTPRAWFPLLYGLSYPLLHGNLNSAIGLGTFLLASAWLLRRADDGEMPSIWWSMLMPSLIYATHGVAYGMWLVLIALTPLPSAARKRLVLGVIPSAAVAAHYVLSRTESSSALFDWGQVGLGEWLIYKLDTSYKQLSPLSLLDPFFVPRPMLWTAVLLNWAMVIGVGALAVAKMRLAFKDASAPASVRGTRLLVITLLLSFLAAPKGLSGLVNPGERLVLPLAALALSLPYVPAISASVSRLVAPALGLLLAAQIVFVGAQGYRAGPVLSALQRTAATMEGAVQLVHESHLRTAEIAQRAAHERAHAALPRHYPLLRAVLSTADVQRVTMPIFETGLFKCRRMDLVVRNLEEAGQSSGDIVVVGEPRRVTAIAAALPLHTPLASGAHFRLLRRVGDTR
jgi:hypothetical protein